MCPALSRRVKILTASKRIIYQPTNSFYQVLSAEAYSKHGFNIHGVVFDELHTQPNRKLFDVMTKGSGDRDVGGVELPVAVGLEGAEHIPDDLLLPVDQLEGLSGPSPLGVAETLDEAHSIVSGFPPSGLRGAGAGNLRPLGATGPAPALHQC